MASSFDPNESDGINDINITPFVDVVLVLLVIFMVTAPVMIKESLKVNLPKSMSSDSSSKTTSMGITITKEGQIIFGGELVSDDSFQQSLQKLAQDAPQTQFLISADVDSRHGDVVKVIDYLKSNGLNQFAIQIEKLKKSP